MLLEAASSGIPVIYAGIENNVAIMKDDGIPFEPRNIKELSSKMIATINNYTKHIEDAKRLSVKIRQKYDWDKIFNSYNQLYTDISRVLGNYDY